MSEQPRVCKCGCGAELRRNKARRMPTWVTGHHGRGKPPHPNTTAAHKGNHGFGRLARDNPNHREAKHWILRDNRGVIHECDNLMSWCRSNEWRFMPDMQPESKTPIWLRAAKGISEMGGTRGKVCSWHGWTLVSVVERQEQGAPDLMDREAV